MADLIIEPNITKDLEYIIMIIERDDGFGYYKDGERAITKSALHAKKFPTRKSASTFIRYNRKMIERKWQNKDPGSVNTNNK